MNTPLLLLLKAKDDTAWRNTYTVWKERDGKVFHKNGNKCKKLG